jgi:serine/threonine-protein kinase
VADVAAGLAYAFERGICHRDMKLSNVLVSSRGQAKLVDFGLAALDKNLSDEDLESVANPRTIDYAGLERATGVRKDDLRSDLYFLGCIYYHLLTGIPPIAETRSKAERLSKTRFQSVVPILEVDPSLPPAVAQVVAKAMELDPALRYQSPGEMLLDLHSAARRIGDVEGEPAAAPGAETSESRAAAPARAAAAPTRAIMFVEANVELQNTFREKLKTSGYRVLVTRDPERALGRFADDPKAADCVVFGAASLGEPALDAFNRFADGRATAQVPAVLLLEAAQSEWKERARLDRHRVAVTMPIKLRELREVLSTLLG